MVEAVKGIKCSACGDIVVSMHTHDFRYCKCGLSFVDGGRSYLRYGCDASINMPEVVDVDVTHCSK